LSLLSAVKSLNEDERELLQSYLQFYGVDWEGFGVRCKDVNLPEEIVKLPPELALLWALQNEFSDDRYVYALSMFLRSKCVADSLG
jgi:hypothetical protein